MVHVQTIILIPAGETEPLHIKVYTSVNLHNVSPQGFLITDTASIVMSNYLWSQFRWLKGNQAEQKKFVDRLPKITSEDLQKRIA